MTRWGWIPIFVVVSGCGANNSKDSLSSGEALCAGEVASRLAIEMPLVLPDFVSPYRVELSTGEVVDQCLAQQDFQTSRALRDLTLARDWNPRDERPTRIDVRVIHLGDCQRIDDDVVRLQETSVFIPWIEKRIEKPGCPLQTIYRADMEL